MYCNISSRQPQRNAMVPNRHGFHQRHRHNNSNSKRNGDNVGTVDVLDKGKHVMNEFGMLPWRGNLTTRNIPPKAFCRYMPLILNSNRARNIVTAIAITIAFSWTIVPRSMCNPFGRVRTRKAVAAWWPLPALDSRPSGYQNCIPWILSWLFTIYWINGTLSVIFCSFHFGCENCGSPFFYPPQHETQWTRNDLLLHSLCHIERTFASRWRTCYGGHAWRYRLCRCGDSVAFATSGITQIKICLAFDWKYATNFLSEPNELFGANSCTSAAIVGDGSTNAMRNGFCFSSYDRLMRDWKTDIRRCSCSWFAVTQLSLSAESGCRDLVPPLLAVPCRSFVFSKLKCYSSIFLPTGDWRISSESLKIGVKRSFRGLANPV